MHAPIVFAAMGALVSTAAAAAVSEPHIWARVPALYLLERQAVEPGTPLYECHYDCGYTILGGEISGYCTNSTWIDLYDGCMECALTEDIWQYYGDQVAEAASSCGLSASPSPSSATGAVSSTAAAATTTSAAAATTATSAAAVSSAASSAASTAVVSSAVVSSAASASVTAATTATTAASTAVSTAASVASSSSASTNGTSSASPSISVVATSGSMTLGYSLSGSLLLMVAGFAAALHM